ncbi:MAG TPA: nitroreductase family deazaflavin-dependent oxidoreductase [Pseudonocardiaceae bacterium]|nr:nitroreductase family deazaflavin-dependent oxidoreductase [Pseudonocardiaceae bacterium]
MTSPNPADLDPRERNQFMMRRIRSGEPQPYQEGRYVLRVVSAPGHRTGQPRPVPIAVVQVSGQRYLCAPNRRRDWVRNLLAAGACQIEGDEPAEHKAVLIEDDSAAKVVATYLGALGRLSAMWPFPSDAPEAEIAKYTNEIAVFRLDPVES